ncbi:phosphoribosyl-AMP cyclohydrolase [Archaeoglobales archaeon]|nr:MAG: phosphoribosyl-AMP cyclohydrolase [Archaeoglobales archaeon]
MADVDIEIKFNEKNLVPVIAQDVETKDVLMLAYANELAIRKTMETGYAHYWSRSRNCLWKKGETSGNTQKVLSILVDCDGDALIYLVNQKGNACHTGERTCFYRVLWGESE